MNSPKLRCSRPALRTLAALPLLCALLAQASQAETVLTYSDHQPLDGMRMQFLKEVFFPAIARESNGRLRIDDHWNGEIAAAYDGLGAVREGSKTDIAVVVPEYTAKDLPLLQIFKGFPVGPAAAKQVSTFRKIFADVPEFNAELQRNGIRPIFLSTGYPAGFFSTQPLSSPLAIAKHKWRSASFWHLDFMQAAGAQPVRMHWGPEIYTALDKGELDGIFVNIDSAYNLDLHKTAKHALVSKNLWLGHLYIIAINEKRWNSLDQQDQQAIERAANFAYEKLGKVMEASYADMLARITEDGAQVREMTDAEVEAWAKASDYQAIQAEWAQGQASEGVSNAAEVIAKVAKLIKED